MPAHSWLRQPFHVRCQFFVTHVGYLIDQVFQEVALCLKDRFQLQFQLGSGQPLPHVLRLWRSDRFKVVDALPITVDGLLQIAVLFCRLAQPGRVESSFVWINVRGRGVGHEDAFGERDDVKKLYLTSHLQQTLSAKRATAHMFTANSHSTAYVLSSSVREQGLEPVDP
jgi:hypothetical protein